MQAAINQIINTAGDIAATVSQLGPGFGLPRRIKKVGKAGQSPVYVSDTAPSQTPSGHTPPLPHPPSASCSQAPLPPTLPLAPF